MNACNCLASTQPAQLSGLGSSVGNQVVHHGLESHPGSYFYFPCVELEVMTIGGHVVSYVNKTNYLV